jgi:hypothetical protein
MASLRNLAPVGPAVDPAISAADIGSIASGNFGWARLDPVQGSAQANTVLGRRHNREEAHRRIDWFNPSIAHQCLCSSKYISR